MNIDPPAPWSQGRVTGAPGHWGTGQVVLLHHLLRSLQGDVAIAVERAPGITGFDKIGPQNLARDLYQGKWKIYGYIGYGWIW